MVNTPPNLYGGRRNVAVRRSPNAQALNMLATAAAGEITASASQPMVRFVKTKQVFSTATQSFIAYGAVQGIQRFFPAAWLDPRFTVQLIFGVPQTVKAIRQGRMNVALAAPVITIAWFVTFTALSGVVQSVLINMNSTYWSQMSRLVGNVIDKRVRGSANSSTLKYKIMQVLGHFVYAYMQYKGTAPTLQGSNSFSRAFAADMTGTLGRGLGFTLKKVAQTAYRHPVETVVATTITAAALVPKKKKNKKRSRNLIGAS